MCGRLGVSLSQEWGMYLQSMTRTGKVVASLSSNFIRCYFTFLMVGNGMLVCQGTRLSSFYNGVGGMLRKGYR